MQLALYFFLFWSVYFSLDSLFLVTHSLATYLKEKREDEKIYIYSQVNVHTSKYTEPLPFFHVFSFSRGFSLNKVCKKKINVCLFSSSCWSARRKMKNNRWDLQRERERNGVTAGMRERKTLEKNTHVGLSLEMG